MDIEAAVKEIIVDQLGVAEDQVVALPVGGSGVGIPCLGREVEDPRRVGRGEIDR